MLSILIPTYNTDISQLIKRLSYEIQEQNLSCQVMVCDDASQIFTDSNKKISLNHNVQYISNERNLGRTATRSKLAKLSNNEWLLFLDSDVIPQEKKFLSEYLHHLSKDHGIIVGGISYEQKKPSSNVILRWKFGTKKEAKTAIRRTKNPYLFPSANLLIKKDIFNYLNQDHSTKYGYDNIFSFRAKEKNIPILHIENPVIHLGLETNAIFLTKSISAIETLVNAENNNELPTNHTRLQKAYLTLEKLNLSLFFQTIFSIFYHLVEKNLLSKYPNMYLFDAFRLSHYIKLKRHA